MNWKIGRLEVTAPNGNVVTFGYEIKESAQVGDVLVVLLEVPVDQAMTENVFCISTEGALKWQIEKTAANSTDPTNWYTGITGHTDRTVQVYNWNGTSNDVDINTGKVVNTVIAR